MWVEPGVDLVVAGSSFRLGKSFKLSGQGQDLPGQCRWFEVFKLRVHGDDGPLAGAPMLGGALMRGEGGIMFLDHPGTMAFFREQLLLGQLGGAWGLLRRRPL